MALSRRDILRIARRFNAGNEPHHGPSPEGTIETGTALPQSFSRPSGTPCFRFLHPSVETLGYCLLSLRRADLHGEAANSRKALCLIQVIRDEHLRALLFCFFRGLLFRPRRVIHLETEIDHLLEVTSKHTRKHIATGAREIRQSTVPKCLAMPGQFFDILFALSQFGIYLRRFIDKRSGLFPIERGKWRVLSQFLVLRLSWNDSVPFWGSRAPLSRRRDADGSDRDGRDPRFQLNRSV